jgi:hypothetical protein
VTSAPDHAHDDDTLPPEAHGDEKPLLTSTEAPPASDKPSVVKCADDSRDDSEDRPTWRPLPVVPRSPTASSGTFEAVPSSKHRFSRRRAG